MYCSCPGSICHTADGYLHDRCWDFQMPTLIMSSKLDSNDPDDALRVNELQGPNFTMPQRVKLQSFERGSCDKAYRAHFTGRYLRLKRHGLDDPFPRPCRATPYTAHGSLGLAGATFYSHPSFAAQLGAHHDRTTTGPHVSGDAPAASRACVPSPTIQDQTRAAAQQTVIRQTAIQQPRRHLIQQADPGLS